LLMFIKGDAQLPASVQEKVELGASFLRTHRKIIAPDRIQVDQKQACPFPS
jgi:hypothetical protein